MEYTIGEFSKRAGLGIHTLRYYEKEGLLSPQRNTAGRRVYSEDDLHWATLVRRLKDTGMSIRDIRHYAELRTLGETTLEKRMELLELHREKLEQKIRLLLFHEEKLDEKIEYYRTLIRERK